MNNQAPGTGSPKKDDSEKTARAGQAGQESSAQEGMAEARSVAAVSMCHRDKAHGTERLMQGDGHGADETERSSPGTPMPEYRHKSDGSERSRAKDTDAGRPRQSSR